ncbi:tetratricopeptide repeat protein [Sporosalibacterium faouarense]|uniref:tetratricopeptide repeat protein n=1 Tax=Sporosalibacterium faouarense TaxID=516123 RepID=UPI00141D4B8A|nr:tetratricopeptide repeat protein [Bacillota bacterium]
MIQGVNQYLRNKSENLSFIQLKKGSDVNVNGYKISNELPLPMVIDELVNEIKEGKAQQEIQMKSIIEGMIYILGVDPDFKHTDEYIEILYSYDENIEEIILAMGLKLVEDNKLEEGLVYFSAVVNMNSGNISGLYNFALALEEKARQYFKNKEMKKGNKFLHESTKYFEEIVDIDPSFAIGYYKLGYHYKHQNQFRKSKIMWEKFLEYEESKDALLEVKQQLSEIKDQVTYEEGYSEVLRGNPLGGLEKLLPLEKIYPDWWNLNFMIGLAYRQTEQYGEAKTRFEKVLVLQPEQVDTLNELGLCLAMENNQEKAIEKFDEALNIKPRDYEILCNRGMTYLQQGNIEKAKSDIEKAYSINSEDEITISCKKHLDQIIKSRN